MGGKCVQSGFWDLKTVDGERVRALSLDVLAGGVKNCGGYEDGEVNRKRGEGR